MPRDVFDLSDDDSLSLTDEDLTLEPEKEPAKPRKPRKEKVPGELLSNIESGLLDRKRSEQKRFQNATDSCFWIAICFQTREEKIQATRFCGLPDDTQYVDGKPFMEALGAEIDAQGPDWKPNMRGVSKKLEDLT